MRKSKIGKYGLIINIIINTIIFILSLIYKNDKIYEFYWISTMILIFFLTYYVTQIDKGLNYHDTQTKLIKYIYDNSSMASLFMYYIFFITIMMLDVYTKFNKYNIYTITMMFVMTLANLWILYASIYNANKETSKMMNKIK